MYLQSGEERHLFVATLDVFGDDGPLGLLVDLIDSHRVILNTASASHRNAQLMRRISTRFYAAHLSSTELNCSLGPSHRQS